ncbi:hypothetical protein Nepgr_013721 [Nepenthes gracilis]|uniref:Alpha/beta hydrolase fold-3 domain-containing protein n=1 Tax=Nepenthes gracilis TaxID=150966 RepID=A0AAD3XPP1_NEPGR|nr:hypothetical protein Nepgr_013721 [Nepenthes gracilis]
MGHHRGAYQSQSAILATPLDGVVSSDVTVDPSRSLWFRLSVPVPVATILPVIIYYHGGGFAFWSPNRKPYDNLCRRLARELPAVVISANYRLAPKHRCPTQYDDCFEALKFIDRNKVDGFPANVDIGKCFLAGDSAGGNSAHNEAVKATTEERSDSELRMKSDAILPLERIDRFWKHFLPDESDRYHPAASVFGSKSKDATGVNNFPATLVVYCEWLKRSNKETKKVEYPNMPHLFYAFPEVPESSMIISEINSFVQDLLAKNRSLFGS